MGVSIPNIPFQGMQKIARLSREIIVTEKIDGTSGLIYIPEVGVCDCGHDAFHSSEDGCGGWELGGMNRCQCREFKPNTQIYAGSRTKWITPEDDNMGFANWVQKNKDELLQLGPGHHFGEWWGKGIQRGYGVPDKRFSLFNVSRWNEGGTDKRPSCCGVVPLLWRGNFDDLLGPVVEGASISALQNILEILRSTGSIAAQGFMKPEGVVIFHIAANMAFKKTIEKDESPKGANR